MKWVRGLLVAAILCATVSAGTWLVHVALNADLGDPAMTLIVVAGGLALLLASVAGVMSLSRSAKS